MNNSADVDPAAFARQELGLGNAVELQVETAKGKKRLMLIPSVCWRSQRKELLIVLEGYSALFYDGVRPLNKFVFCAHGVPFLLAEKLAEFMGAIMLGTCRVRLRQSAPPAELLNPQTPTET